METSDLLAKDAPRFKNIDDELAACTARLSAGDRSARAELIELTQNRLYRFCFHLTGSPQPAEELCQEVYLKALSHLEELNNPKTIFSWLFKIARNRLIDLRRLSESKLEKLTSSPSEEEPDLLANQPSLSASDAELLASIEDTLSRMTPDDRMAILLIDHEQYSYSEAAEIMGVSETALANRLLRARKRFFELFQGGG